MIWINQHGVWLYSLLCLFVVHVFGSNPWTYRTSPAVVCMCTWGVMLGKTVDIWVFISTPKSSWFTYRFIWWNSKSNDFIFIHVCKELNYSGSCFETTFTHFAFTNTDSDDVRLGCSLTGIVSVTVGFRNLSYCDTDYGSDDTSYTIEFIWSLPGENFLLSPRYRRSSIPLQLGHTSISSFRLHQSSAPLTLCEVNPSMARWFP